MVGVAGDREAAAAGEAAVLVAKDEGLPDRGGDQPLGAADVEDLAATAEHGRDHYGVTGEPTYRRRGQLLTGAQRRGADPG